MQRQYYKMGIDIGSTTVKVVVIYNKNDISFVYVLQGHVSLFLLFFH